MRRVVAGLTALYRTRPKKTSKMSSYCIRDSIAASHIVHEDEGHRTRTSSLYYCTERSHRVAKRPSQERKTVKSLSVRRHKFATDSKRCNSSGIADDTASTPPIDMRTLPPLSGGRSCWPCPLSVAVHALPMVPVG